MKIRKIIDGVVHNKDWKLMGYVFMVRSDLLKKMHDEASIEKARRVNDIWQKMWCEGSMDIKDMVWMSINFRGFERLCMETEILKEE